MPLKIRRKRISVTNPVPSKAVGKRGPKPRSIIEFPAAKSNIWADTPIFHEALAQHIERHGDTAWHLHKAIVGPKDRIDRKTIVHWVSGTKVPRSVSSLEILGHIEKRYGLPVGYFASKLPHTGRAADGHLKLGDMTSAQRRRFAWHLPADFDCRPLKERREILDWVQRVIISGATDYRCYQRLAMRQRYALRFVDLNQIQPCVRVELDEDREGEGLVIIIMSGRVTAVLSTLYRKANSPLSAKSLRTNQIS